MTRLEVAARNLCSIRYLGEVTASIFMLKNRETASPKFPDNARNREITGKGSRISS